MFMDAFAKCTATEITFILEKLTTLDPQHNFHEQGLIALKKKLSFYPDAFYFNFTQADHHPVYHQTFVLGTNDKAYLCRGNADDLILFNQSYPLMIDRNLVLDYVRFYFAHIIGPYGPSILIDVVEDLQLREEPTPALRHALHDKIIPLSLNASLAGGGYQTRATLLVMQTLYSVFIDVAADGRIKVELGRVLADLLPVNDRALEG